MSEVKTRRKGFGRGCGLLGIGAVVGCLGVFVVGALAMVALSMFASRFAGDGMGAKIADASVLEVRLTGVLAEAPPLIDFGELFGAPVSSLWALRQALEEAVDDERISAVQLTIDNAAYGWATAEEVVTLLDRVRAAGKPIVAHLPADLVSDLDYFLATAADTIVINPQGASAINGLILGSPHLRGTLEKLGIEPKVIQYKEYKSAGELFANYEMSAYAREALSAILEDITAVFTRRVTERRGIGEQALSSFVALGMAPAQALVDAELVDELGYVDQIEEILIERAELDEYRGVSLDHYLRSVRARSMGSLGFGGDHVAVVFGEGAIVAQPAGDPFALFGPVLFSGPQVAQNIRRAVEDPHVRAIVFRVNSPGGSAVGSDFVRRELDRARAAGKPVVVSMSDVAGSGGYWVAMAADAIVAHPSTITGSIGVVFSGFNLDGLWEKIGANFDEVKTAPNAGVLGTGDWDEDDRVAIESWMQAVYDNFTGAVAEYRELPLERVAELARGRIWSGTDALEHDLIDGVGGLDEAIRLAREKAGIGVTDEIPVLVFPRPKPFFQALLEGDFASETPPVSRLGAGLLHRLEVEARPQVRVMMVFPAEVR